MPIDLLADDAFTQKKEPVDLLAMADSIPEENLASKIGKLPIELIKDVQSGAALRNLAQGALTGLGKGGQLIGQALTGGKAKPIDIDEVFHGVGTNNGGLSESLEKGFGSYAPYGAVAGPRLIGQMLVGAAHGAATAKPGERTKGALEESLLNALLHGAGKTLETLRPSKLFRGQLSPEELSHNLEVTSGTETPLGEVVKSPSLKRLQENILPNVLGSGTYGTMQRNAKNITKLGEGLMDKIPGQINPESQNKDLRDALKKAHDQARDEKNENFEKVNKKAEDLGIQSRRENFSKSATEALDEINSSDELKHEFPKDIVSDLERYSKNKKEYSLKQTDIFRSKLGDKADEFYENNKNYEAGILKKLQRAITKDRDASIEDSGDKELKDLHAKAFKHYQENYSQFEDPDLQKFIKRGGDTDLILSHFLRTGQSDRANLISKVIKNIPGDQKSIPLKMYLSKAMEEGNLNPLKLRALYNKLGPNQKKALITDKSLRNKLENYMDLVGKNTESFTAMANPKTGQRTLESTLGSLVNLSPFAGGGYALGNIPGALAGLAIPGLASRGTNKLLTSPKIRESLVRAMLENRPKFSNKIQGTQSLLQTLKAALEQGNNQ